MVGLNIIKAGSDRPEVESSYLLLVLPTWSMVIMAKKTRPFLLPQPKLSASPIVLRVDYELHCHIKFGFIVISNVGLLATNFFNMADLGAVELNGSKRKPCFSETLYDLIRQQSCL